MNVPRWRTALLYTGLFALTVCTTLLAGAEQATGKTLFYTLSWADLPDGIPYSFAFLLFLTVHEFGHYFTALYHGVRSSFPYYIPMYIPFVSVLNIGSFGAVIRLRETPPSRRAFFDIGVAGPLAGFVISVGLLVYGLSHLPDAQQYIYHIHPDYKEWYGGVPGESTQRAFIFGNKILEKNPELLAQLQASGQSVEEFRDFGIFVNTNLLFELLKWAVPHNPADLPNGFELIHYPYLFVGFLTLFFTALNLLPIGQLDGGHVIYGLFGPTISGVVSRAAVILLLLAGGTGVMDVLNLQDNYLTIGAYAALLIYVLNKMFGPERQWVSIGLWAGLLVAQIGIKLALPAFQPNLVWLLYALLAVRVIGLDHPQSFDETPLSPGRKVLGWLAIAIFVLCFTPNPIEVVGG